MTEELEDFEAVSSLMMLYNSPMGVAPITKSLPVVPPLTLDMDLLTSVAEAAQPQKMKYNMKSLINIIEGELPRSASKSKGRRRSSMISTHNLRRNNLNMNARKRSSTLQFDPPVTLLPRLRSHSRKRRSSLIKRKELRSNSADDVNPAVKSGSCAGDVGTSGRMRMIGVYGPKERKELIQRFMEKRKKRVWGKKIKYAVRKTFADSRLRVKGRFISKGDESTLRECLTMFM